MRFFSNAQQTVKKKTPTHFQYNPFTDRLSNVHMAIIFTVNVAIVEVISLHIPSKMLIIKEGS